VAAQLPHASAPPASPPVPYDIPAKTPEPTIKKRKPRKRKNADQSKALNRMFFSRTIIPSKEERLQLADDLNMSTESVKIWLVHIFVYMYNSRIIGHSLRFKNKRRSIRQGRQYPAGAFSQPGTYGFSTGDPAYSPVPT
jgi:homeobox domain-containing protein